MQNIAACALGAMTEFDKFESIMDRLRLVVEDLDKVSLSAGPSHSMRLDVLCHLQRALDLFDELPGPKA